MTTDRISGIALLILSLFVVWEDRNLPLGTHSIPGPGYLPLMLASFLAILAIIMIIRGSASLPFRSISWIEGRHALAILICSLFATFFLESLGYRLTVLIILLFLFGVMERIKWWLTICLSFGLSFGSFWLFDTLLKVILPRGGLGL